MEPHQALVFTRICVVIIVYVFAFYHHYLVLTCVFVLIVFCMTLHTKGGVDSYSITKLESLTWRMNFLVKSRIMRPFVHVRKGYNQREGIAWQKGMYRSCRISLAST